MSAVFQPPGPPPVDDEVARLRIPPHSIEAEQSVLGGLLLDNTAWDRAGDLLTDSDFYRYEHRLIYSARRSVRRTRRPWTSFTLWASLWTGGDEAGETG